MPVTVRSFAKINLGLCIGPLRPDGFHSLRTVYQTIALHDILKISIQRGSGVEIECKDSRVPTGESNTCFTTAQRVMSALGAKGKVVIRIEKTLPVQGGLGGASANAVATLLGIERALRRKLPGSEKLRIAAEVGSDVPLFLIGGTVLGVGRGEEVYPLPDLPSTHCVVVLPNIGVSTPQAFKDWDQMIADSANSPGVVESPPRSRNRAATEASELTLSGHSDRMNEFGRRVSSWLSGLSQETGTLATGAPALGRSRAETPLLDLVRAGIENDFERVVFPKYPELRDMKRVLEGEGAFYSSLSGSGSALYGLFRTRAGAQKAASRLTKKGIAAQATTTLTRQQYAKKFLVSSS